MTTKIIEWKKNNEYEIMKWVYNYSRHEVYRYFRDTEGKITKTKLGCL